jgi:hypothetical protein
MSPDETIARGSAAQVLLANETFNVICEDILTGRAAHWLAETDPEKREALWIEVRAIHSIRDELKARIDAAKKAQSDIDARDRRAKEI